jgi:hypothetical protein
MALGKKEETKSAVPVDIGRNDPCRCGSGKKYKKCCMGKDEAAEHKALEESWKKSEAVAQEQNEKQTKETKENPATKHATAKSAAKQQHPTFVPHQVNLPRKSGGG